MLGIDFFQKKDRENFVLAVHGHHRKEVGDRKADEGFIRKNQWYYLFLRKK